MLTVLTSIHIWFELKLYILIIFIIDIVNLRIQKIFIGFLLKKICPWDSLGLIKTACISSHTL